MKLVIIGGSGLIGTKVVSNLKKLGHEAVAASPRSGVNSLTGEGLRQAVAGADVIVDVSNSPSFEDQAVLEFFETSTRNLIAAAKAAGVKHFVALSVVGADRLPDSGYMRAKVAQEKLIKESGIHYSILRATQFLEFLSGIAGSAADGNDVRLPSALIQPVAADDVAATVANIATGAPTNGVVELAGPEAVPMDQLIRRYFSATKDTRVVKTDPQAQYFGAALEERSLVPVGSSRIGSLSLEKWLGA